MSSNRPGKDGDRFHRNTPHRLWLRLADCCRQISRLRWLIPVSLVLLVIAYEVGPSRWVYDAWGFTYHLLVEILLFGTIGPVLVFLCLTLLERWLDEKETSDWQAQLLAKANDHVDRSRQLSDDTLQVLFAMGVLIARFKTDRSELPPDATIQIEATEQALDNAIERLRSHLME
jgi:hypothetical protein